MKRREFIAQFGSAAALWTVAARAQQAERVRRIGLLLPYGQADSEGERRVTVFQQGLRGLGWTEGVNIQIDYRWTAGDTNRIGAFAAELVDLAPAVILATNTPTTRALRQATHTIPIVFVSVSDPVGDGFVASLAKPGGNITGFSNYDPDIAGKWLQLLREIAPNTRRVAIIFNPETAPHTIFLPMLKAAVGAFAMELLPAPVHDAAQIETAISTIGQQAGSGLLAMPDSFISVHRKLVAALAAQHRLPAVYPFRWFATSGGLISYGVDVVDQYRRAPSYVDRILRGANPGELPVQEPNKFELVINLKTAKALGLTVPASLLARADEVIE